MPVHMLNLAPHGAHVLKQVAEPLHMFHGLFVLHDSLRVCKSRMRAYLHLHERPQSSRVRGIETMLVGQTSLLPCTFPT